MTSKKRKNFSETIFPGDYWEKGVPWPQTSSTLAETDVSSPATINTVCNGGLDPQTREQFSLADVGSVDSNDHTIGWQK